MTPSMQQDHYQVLGIAPGASLETVRRAYRILARELHPDVNSAPDAAHRFAAVTTAYRVLSDPAQRQAYDRQRRSTRPVTGSPATVRAARGVLRGRDVELTLHLSLRESVFGVQRRVEVPRREVCAVCVGTGAAPDAGSVRCPQCLGTGGTRSTGEECPRCQGSGVLADPPCANCGGAGRRQGLTAVTLSIPPDMQDGQRLVLKGEGDAGPRNGPRGDLILHMVVDPDPVLRRAGIDILMDLTLDATHAAQGLTVEVPSLKGPRTLRVPSGVRDGQILRLSGAGVRPRGMLWHRGDQFVTVHLVQRGEDLSEQNRT